MKPILEIKNISKKFMINHEQQPYLSLRDSIANVFKSASQKQAFWALDDVSFNVERGDSIGIIGKNGAGKSTLLKILSKITPPTSGRIIGRGRIASLLEVGTGFHPELSGRENVFMNGSILGMKRSEILKNFDAIVDFAGVSKFIDTPLKHYSSGMQLRLAFAVSAFLENEILIIDEVLAVGDAEFQKRCMGKMGDISKSGRTILFVSHNTFALSQLCQKSVLLERGKLIKAGSTLDIIDYYNNSDNSNLTISNSIAIGKNVMITDLKIHESQDLNIEFNIKTNGPDVISAFALFINNSEGYRIAIVDCRTRKFPIKSDAGSEFKIDIDIKELALVEGTYYVGVYIESNTFKGNIENVFQITAQPKKIAEHLILPYPKEYRGVLELDYTVNKE
jgi:lipopolysaccharide transport system ATP-binding protein